MTTTETPATAMTALRASMVKAESARAAVAALLKAGSRSNERVLSNGGRGRYEARHRDRLMEWTIGALDIVRTTTSRTAPRRRGPTRNWLRISSTAPGPAVGRSPAWVRRLTEEGTSFKVLVDDIRRELARRYLGRMCTA